ncbi:MAG: putative amidase AmiD [Anaerolineae bacterium]|nr:putative amidase AmiD [Anaerolineae bacterium]
MANQLETRLAPLAQKLRSGQLKLSDYLDQLEAVFSPENERIQAFLPEEHRFDRLRGQAAELEARFPAPESRPPLFGVPVGVKDIFNADGFITRAGSKLPAEVLTGPQAKVVTQLKEAGALVLGKTVTTEFAYFAPGPTRNPYNPNHTPGGSSSGSAAAVGAGIAPLALGSQTIGSIIRPAAFCGCIGYKPSVRRISAEGVIPLSPSLDHIGFFTRDLDGLELAASILCKNWHAVPPPQTRPVLGVPLGPYLDKTGPEGMAHFKAVQQKLANAGFTIVPVEVMANFDAVVVWHNDMMAAELALVHQEWGVKYKELYHPRTAALIERGRQVARESIKVYQAEREWLRNELREAMAEHNISVWISPPALGTAPEGIGSTGDPIMNLPWTYAGLPALSIPAGLGASGLPLGLQLAADFNRDELLIQWAKQIEQALAS